MTMETKIVTEEKFIKYTFSEEELKELASDMAKAVAEKVRLEEQKKSVASQFKADIDKAAAQISSLSIDYNQGHKFKNHPCEVHYDYEQKEVRVYRQDTGELVTTRTMKAEEFQQEMFDQHGHSITAPEEGKETPPEDLTDQIEEDREPLEDTSVDQELFKDEPVEEATA